MKSRFNLITIALNLSFFAAVPLSYAQDPGIPYRQAMELFKKGDLRGTVLKLEEALELGINERVDRDSLLNIYQVLGTAYFRISRTKEDLRKAVRYLRLADEMEGGKGRFHRTLVKAIRRLEEEEVFKGEELKHFKITYQGPSDMLAAERIINILEEGYERIGRELGYEGTKPIETVLHMNEEFKKMFDFSGNVLGSLDVSRIHINVRGAEQDERLEPVLYHQLTHVLLYRMIGGSKPGWLHEGLSQYMESFSPHTIRRRKVFTLAGRLIPIRELESSSAVWRGKMGDTGRAYSESLRIVNYLIERYGMGKLTDLIRALSKGDAIQPAVEKIFAIRYEDLPAISVGLKTPTGETG